MTKLSFISSHRVGNGNYFFALITGQAYEIVILLLITVQVREPRGDGTAAITFQRIIGGFTHNAGHPN